MNASDKDERRRHHRVGFETTIRIHLETDGRKVELEGNSKDLSLKGIFVKTDETFATGTKCDVKVYLSGSLNEIELVMKGAVARIGRNGMGIVFNSMDVDTYSHLKNLVYYNTMNGDD